MKSAGKGNVTLQFADNNEYLKCYMGHYGMSVMVGNPQQDAYSILKVGRGGTNCNEYISDYKFDMENLVTKEIPVAVGNNSLTNDTDVPGEQTVNVSYAVETESTFQFEETVTIGAETTFKAGIPFLIEGEIKTKAEATFTASQSFSKKETLTIAANVNVTVPPHSYIRASSIIRIGQADVPFTATVTHTLKQGDTGQLYKYGISGTFTGTNAYDITTTQKTN